MKKYEVRLEFVEPLLGTVSGNEELYRDFLASKAAGEVEDEIDSLPEALEKGTTGFHRTSEGKPMIYDYAVKGFFKDACSMLNRDPGSGSSKLKAFRKVIDGLVFVMPRRILLYLPDGAEIGILERPLRAQTAQGERVALARSESCPPGTRCTFTVTVLAQVSRALLEEWLIYGGLRGLGQWRNAGYGRFSYEIEEA